MKSYKTRFKYISLYFFLCFMQLLFIFIIFLFVLINRYSLMALSFLCEILYANKYNEEKCTKRNTYLVRMAFFVTFIMNL